MIGNKLAHPTYLEALQNTVSKDKHMLRESDVNLKDKMNYHAVDRLCQPHIQQLLEAHVPG